VADALDGMSANARVWTPVHVTQFAAVPSILWARLNEPLSDPFFEMSAERAMRRPFNQLFARRTGFEALDDFGGGEAIRPAGFVFHQSRCGSTLVAQMLAQLDASTVLSEAQPIDAVLAGVARGEAADRAILARRLRAMIHALSAAQTGTRKLFVKWHAWHAFELAFIMAAFPGVPWVFLFREPREMLASHARRASAEAFGSAIPPSYLTGEASPPDSLSRAAQFLGKLARAAIRDGGAGRGAYVRYDSLPEAVFTRVLPHFGIVPSSEERERMHAAARRDAKEPQQAYRPRPVIANVEHDERARRWLDEPYAELSRLAATGR
jgi:hypothetical protein